MHTTQIPGTYWVQNHQDKNKNICSKIKNKNNSSKFQTFPQTHTFKTTLVGTAVLIILEYLIVSSRRVDHKKGQFCWKIKNNFFTTSI